MWLESFGQWLVKLIGGWLPIGTKPVSEWFGKVLWAVGIFFLLTFATNLWDKVFPQKPNKIELGPGSVYNAGEPRDTFGVGCNIMRLYVKAGFRSK